MISLLIIPYQYHCKREQYYNIFIKMDSQLLQDHNQEGQILMVDQIYAKGFNHFKVTTMITFLYSIMKVITIPIFLGITDSNEYDSQILAWMICMQILSFLQTFHYFRMWKMMNNPYFFLNIAEHMRHGAFYQRNQFNEESQRSNIHPNMTNYLNPLDRINDRQIRILSMQIKYHFINQRLSINIPARAFFFIYQGLHIWGFVIFMRAQSGQYSYLHHLLIIILFLGTYQYIEFYSLVVIVLIAGPFLLIYSGIVYLKAKRKRRMLAKTLEGCKFQQGKIKGETICQICMQQYRQGDLVATLPCNSMHHFHSICIKQWIKVSETCPLCRKQIQSQ